MDSSDEQASIGFESNPEESKDGKIEFIKVQFVPSAVLEDQYINEDNMEAVEKMEEAVLMLIDCIKRKPELWKLDEPSYRVPLAHHEAWHTLSSKFGIPAEDLKDKWALLRTQFRANLAKVRASRRSGMDKEYQPTWFAYEAMKFLRDTNNYCSQDTMPELWNRKSENCNKSAQSKCWEKLATKFQMPVEDAKAKWKVLETQYRKNHLKVKINSESGSASEVFQPEQCAYEAMKFVLENENDGAVEEEVADERTEDTGPTAQRSPKVTRQSRDSKRVIPGPIHVPGPIHIPVELRRMKINSSPPAVSKPTTTMSRTKGSVIFSEIEPLITQTFQNLSKITGKIAETKASPYNGLLEHLSLVLSKKAASDYDQIEGILLNCLHQLNKFPNVTHTTANDSANIAAHEDVDIDSSLRLIESSDESV
uniref:MADF domain-containing protein n=1 Tax=Anopheles dirus TaxID=7168 RepID=A0A182N887_9DIPT